MGLPGAGEQGLNLTAVSYDGVLALSAVAGRNMLPDPGLFVAYLRESFAELTLPPLRSRCVTRRRWLPMARNWSRSWR
jgi:hypothetical protein